MKPNEAFLKTIIISCVGLLLMGYFCEITYFIFVLGGCITAALGCLMGVGAKAIQHDSMNQLVKEYTEFFKWMSGHFRSFIDAREAGNKEAAEFHAEQIAVEIIAKMDSLKETIRKITHEIPPDKS